MTRPAILSQSQSLAGEGLLLNIINEFDLVTRTDSPYILSLVNLYRSIYQLPPMQDAKLHKRSITKDVQSTLAQHPSGNQDMEGLIWAVPSPLYYHVGKLLMLRVQIRKGDSSSANCESMEEALEMRAVKVRAEDFEKLLFCRITVHSRVCYGERVKLVAEGHFNGMNGWAS
jgi:hypothetical protein